MWFAHQAGPRAPGRSAGLAGGRAAAGDVRVPRCRAAGAGV